MLDFIGPACICRYFEMAYVIFC